jgi:hypothetical protein
VTKVVTIDVAKATPTITWPIPSEIADDIPLTAAQLKALANVSGRYLYSPGPGALLTAGPGRTLSVTFTPDDDANYTPATKTLTIDVSKGTPIAVTLAADVTFPARFNRTVTWSARASVTSGLEYSFWRHDDTGWTEVQPYSATPAYRWTPAYGDIGTHALQVWVRRVGATVAYQSWAAMEFPIGAGALPSATSLKASSVLPSPAGTPVTWTASVVGGVSPQCQFWRSDPDGWHLVQAYGACQYTWTPNVADVGSHSLQVWVRNIDSLAPYESYQALTFAVRKADPLVLKSLVLQPPAAYAVGSPMIWVADTTGGLAPVQYQFWRRDADGWHMVADYGPSKTYRWTPTASDIGQHELQVWVRSSGSSVNYETATGVAFAIGAPQPLVVSALDADVASPSAGFTITWRATTTGGLAPLEYKFWRLDANGWHVVQDYGALSSYTWTPTVADVGPHALQVWVRNDGSTKDYDNWRGVTFTVGPPLPIKIIGMSADVALPAASGTAIKWTASASGGMGSLEYQFWRRDGTTWSIGQPYGATTTYTWTPSPADAGVHAVQVWIRSVGSAAPYEAYAGTGDFVIK